MKTYIKSLNLNKYINDVPLSYEKYHKDSL